MEKLRKSKRNLAFKPWKQIGIGLGILLVTVLFSLFFLLELAEEPFDVAKERAIKIVQEHVKLKKVEEVHIYHSKETYYSVIGKNNQDKEILILVPEASPDLFVYDMEAGISSKEAEAVAKENGATTIERTILGYRDGKPIWEVKAGTTYYSIEFESGQLLKKEGL